MVVQKLSEEVDSLKARLEVDSNTKQDAGNAQHSEATSYTHNNIAGSRQKERERDLYNKVKAAEDALQKERERAIVAEESILQLRKKHREELENLRIPHLPQFLCNRSFFDSRESSAGAGESNDHNENGTDDQENGANGIVEQKLKQELSEEKLELEKLGQSLSEARRQYTEDMQRLDSEKAALLEDYQKMEDKQRFVACYFF